MLKVMVLAELVRPSCAPPQVVLRAGAPVAVRPAGNVSINAVCVNANGLVFDKVVVRLADAFTATLVGAKTCATAGAAGATLRGTGHAVATLPAFDGAVLVCAEAVKLTVAVSEFPAESVTLTLSEPAPLHLTVGCAVDPPEIMETAPVALHR